MILQDFCPPIKNILLQIGFEGKRIAVKYYSDDWPSNSAKLAFEKSVFSKTKRRMLEVKVLAGCWDTFTAPYVF